MPTINRKSSGTSRKTLPARRKPSDVFPAAGNLGATDEEQLRYAASKRRVFITHNLKDFVALHARFVSAGKTHAGMVLVIRRRNANSIVLRLLHWIQSATSQDMENQLRYL